MHSIDDASQAADHMHDGGAAREPGGAGSSGSSLRRTVLGLQTRFTLLVVGLALAVAAVVGMVTFNVSVKLIRRAHADACRQTADLVARRAAGVYANGAEALSELGHEVVHSDSILFISFMEANGNGIARVRERRMSNQAIPTAGFTPHTSIGVPRYFEPTADMPGYLDVTYPVRAVPEDGNAGVVLLGYARVGMSVQRTLGELRATMEFLTGICVLISALTVPLGFILVRRLIGPVQHLSGTINRFAAGDLAARCRLHRADELGDLATAYNEMADRLAQKHAEISQLNTELEERVQQRTRQLRELAIRDGLTGLYNRRYFAEVIDRAFDEARRYDRPLACMMVDLDNFKQVNDRCGHQSGDEVLMFVAGRIRDELRSSDVAARYGGDEFVVLLPQTDLEQARLLASRVRDAINFAVIDRAAGCDVTLSVGVAATTDSAVNCPDDLVRFADRALYAAKERGKNQVVVNAAAG
jgi:diguanylate cyclase (GGDEF)-like protein